MWLLLAFLSATLLGFYDVFKKSLKDNAVLPVLFLNTFPVSSFCRLFCFLYFNLPYWKERYSMSRLRDGNSINILLSSRSSCFPHGYSVISG